jgi:nucleoid-associated protein YgaU
MPKWSLLPPVLMLVSAAASAQVGPSAVDFANMQEDIRGLTQKVNDLSLRVEQLEHQSSDAGAQNSAPSQGYATLVQLNAAVTELNHTIEVATAASKSDILDDVAVQMQKLVRQVNSALAAAGRGRPAPAAGDAGSGSDFPTTGVSYTVQKGDTVELIAKRTGARVQDIIDANKLADPSLIRVGQSLFIPGGK